MSEKDFTKEMMRGLEALGGLSHKIEDVALSQFGKRDDGSKRGAGKKPFDVMWQYNGIFHAIENKQEAFSVGISCDLLPSGKPRPGLQAHQEEALLNNIQHGGAGWLVCHFHGPLNKGQEKRFGVQTLDRAFAVDARKVNRARIEQGLRSVDFDWCLANGVELVLGRADKGRAWDCSCLAVEAYKSIQPARPLEWSPR